jgi:hypothetical protein
MRDAPGGHSRDFEEPDFGPESTDDPDGGDAHDESEVDQIGDFLLRYGE